MRDPDRLPPPRACRLDRRLADLHTGRRVPVRRRTFRPQVAGRRSPRTARRRDDRQPGPLDAGRGVRGAGCGTARFGRLGRRHRAESLGALRGVRRRHRAGGIVGRHGALGCLRGAVGEGRTINRPGDRTTDAGPPRAVPLGHRFPLGRMARARLRDPRLRGVRRGRQVGGRDGVPAPIGSDDGPHRRGARQTGRNDRAVRGSWPPPRGTPGSTSTSPTTDR